MKETDSPPRSGRLRFNKACGLEDFTDPELVAVLRDVFVPEVERSAGYPAGAERRKHWEVAMSVRALREFGALRPDAELLGVGAGSEATVFYLTRHARRVVATDLYLAPGVWEREAHPLMLIAPEQLSPFPFERERLEVLHMDGRWLRFPDDSFDGIFSSGSIEHFGDLEDLAAAAFEMGRVLKPGGVLALATELLLEGPPGSIGWPGVVLFSPQRLRRHVIAASGLEPVDELDLEVSDRTLATGRPLEEMIREIENGRERFPHLVLTHDGQMFCSVHLTLRKTGRYPFPGNSWARPAQELRERVQRGEAEAEERLFGPAVEAAEASQAEEAAAPPAAEEPPPPSPAPEEAAVEALYRRWDAVRARGGVEAAAGGAVRRALGFLLRTARRIRDLGTSWDLQRDLFRAILDRQIALDQRLAASEEALARTQAREAEIFAAVDFIRKFRAIQESNSGTELRERYEILRVRQARLEGLLADLRAEIEAPQVGG
jgi:SAM-dependent methyltransferase